MEGSATTMFFAFTSFMKGKRDAEYEEVDGACLTPELFEDTNCHKTLLPLYFFLTRNKGKKMPVARMKKTFGCGAELIQRVSRAIEEKKPLQVPGRKKDKPVRKDQTLIGLVDAMTRADGGLSNAALAKQLGTSEASVNRIRRDLAFVYKPLRHGPRLLTRHFGTRLAFCLLHQDDDWSKVLFTDESRFSTSPDCPIMWWVKRGDHVYLETDKFPFSIMVWAGVIGSRKTQLIKCPQRLDAHGYVAMLEEHGVIEFLTRVDNTAIFQQDGAPCHTAVLTRRWFEGQNARLLDRWPANSPDLSPIEQIWGITKRFIIQRYGMTTPLENDQLENVVFEAYERIEPRTIAILTLSVKHRIRLCVARQGGFVGDALEECCRRATVEYDSMNTIQRISISREAIGGSEQQGTEGEDSQDNLPRLPSFRLAQ